MITFKKLGLNSELLQGLEELGFTEPSPIQEKAIPFILESKKDLIALAQTGTGKTAAFGLPILNQIETNKKELQAIILCPTRELCLQISQDIKNFSKYSKGVAVTAVYGGERIDIQIRSLRRGANIIVGTPGRVHDLIRRKFLKLQSIQTVVLDEADEMLDMGFKEDLDAILEQTPKTKRTLLFSATISRNVHSIAKRYMNEAEEISIGEKNVGAEKVTHEYYITQPRDRFDTLQRILDFLPGVYGILFCRTRNQTQEVADKLKQANYDAEALHGEISQVMRTKIMARFKQKQIRLLVATDVAARGIDVNDLTHVINYNLPDHDGGYTHRSGRTGRAAKSGVSILILSPGEVRKVKKLEDMIGKTIEYKKIPDGEGVCRKQIDSFVSEIENTDIEKTGYEKYFEEIILRLKKIKKEDLIKHFIAHKFNHLMNNYKEVRDLNAKAKKITERMSDADSVNLKINFGKKSGFEVKSLFALINSNRKLQGVEIGRINVMPEYSIFSVEKERAGEVVDSLNGRKSKGQKVIVEKTDLKIGFQRNSGGGQRRRPAGGGRRGAVGGGRRGMSGGNRNKGFSKRKKSFSSNKKFS